MVQHSMQGWDSNTYDHFHEHHSDDDEHDHSKCVQMQNSAHDFDAKAKLPVTLLTGYLGAGKTTLLNYLLREQSEKKIAVIENEVGEVSIDDELVNIKNQNSVARFEVLENGCICCTLRNDLATTLADMAKSNLDLDGVVIELTGMADPAPVVQTFFMHDEVRKAFFVDNVIALVDARYAMEKLDESRGDPKLKGTANAQIAFSSTVLLNKIDLVCAPELNRIENRIKVINSTTTVIRCIQAKVPVELIINVGAFNLSKVLEEQYLDEEEFNLYYEPKMDTSVSNVGIRCPGAINLFRFRQMLDAYIGWPDGARDFLRVKAVLNIAGNEQKFVLQCVHSLRNLGFTVPWGDQPRENKIIFIGRNMQRRRLRLIEDLQACMAEPLRFAIGTPVKVRPESVDEYSAGIVVAHWEDCHAYRVTLPEAGDVHIPDDDDSLIKAYEN